MNKYLTRQKIHWPGTSTDTLRTSYLVRGWVEPPRHGQEGSRDVPRLARGEPWPLHQSAPFDVASAKTPWPQLMSPTSLWTGKNTRDERERSIWTDGCMEREANVRSLLPLYLPCPCGAQRQLVPQWERLGRRGRHSTSGRRDMAPTVRGQLALAGGNPSKPEEQKHGSLLTKHLFTGTWEKLKSLIKVSV